MPRLNNMLWNACVVVAEAAALVLRYARALVCFHLEYIRLRLLFYYEQPQMLHKKLGLDWNIPMPISVHELITRLCLLEQLDAYSVLGLKVTASLAEVQQTSEHLLNFLDYEGVSCLGKTTSALQAFYPGVDECRALIVKAAETLHSAKACQEYAKDFKVVSGNLRGARLQLDLGLVKLQLGLRYVVNAADYFLGCECGQAHLALRVETSNEPRFCRRCKERHSVRNMDVWMARKNFGLSWSCFASIDNAVYDISAWVACPVSGENAFANLTLLATVKP